MLHFLKLQFIGTLCFNLSLVLMYASLSSYVSVPRSPLDTTDRMNAGGDPPDRPGLIDDQRSPEFLDDWWGENDYYYSTYGIHETGRIRDPVYNSGLPPYYAYPNTTYQPVEIYRNSNPESYYEHNRYYHHNYPR